jgi:hypothetical protein
MKVSFVSPDELRLYAQPIEANWHLQKLRPKILALRQSAVSSRQLVEGGFVAPTCPP